MVTILLAFLLACREPRTPTVTADRDGSAGKAPAVRVIPTAVPLVPTSPPFTGLHLRSIRATSGVDVDRVVDGDEGTGWRIEGDPVDEAVLMRFEVPVRASALEVVACPGAQKAWWNVIVNGAEAGRVDASPAVKGSLRLGPGTGVVRLASLELQVADGSGGACLAEIVLKDGDTTLAVRPPRTVEGTIRSSSVRVPSSAHHPWYLVDGRPGFSWTEGTSGPGVGESVTVALRAAVSLVSVELWNGNQRSPEAFAAGARATRFGVSVDRRSRVSVAVADLMGPQRLHLPQLSVGKLFVFSIVDVALGGTGADLSIAELRLWDPMGPLAIRTPDPGDRRASLVAEALGSGIAGLFDRRFEQVCTAPGARRLKLRSNLSFSWSGPGAGLPGEARESFEGDWALRRVGKVWSAIELAGRRRPVVMSWVEPEADREDLGVVQTAEIARVSDLGEAPFAEWLAQWSRGELRPVVECVTERARDADLKPMEYLIRREAIVVRGQAFNDLLWPAG